MITIGTYSFRWDDPVVLVIAGAVALLLVILLLTLRAAGRSARMAEPMMREMGWMANRVQALSDFLKSIQK